MRILSEVIAFSSEHWKKQGKKGLFSGKKRVKKQAYFFGRNGYSFRRKGHFFGRNGYSFRRKGHFFGIWGTKKRKENIYILHLRLQRVRAYACVRGKNEKKKTHKEKNPCGLKKHEVKIPFLSFAGKRPSVLCPCFLF